MAETDTVTDIESSIKVVMRPPSKFNVVLYNDDKTTVEFVVLVLMTIFHKNFDAASQLTMLIHENGRGVAGTYSLEIASQKRDETIHAARTNKYPLRCEIEES
jgi:ATP-dependent Clp protease adaptor protein ClpS